MKKALVLLSALILTVASVYANTETSGQDDDYDRLDGMGKSGQEVHVIEWAGNLEIHVYPHGSLEGLALKLDEKNKNKPVMVIGYRFKGNPKEQLIRRNVLSIKLPNFKVFVDPREKEFDKIIISSNTLASVMKPFKLDPEPTQLYPEGHPMLAQKEEPKKDEPTRAPASKGEKMPVFNEETGAIKHFFGQ